MNFPRLIAWPGVLVILVVLALASTDAALWAQDWESTDIRLKNRVIQKPRGIESELSASLAAMPGERLHIVLQLAQPLTDEDYQGLEDSGVQLLSYLGDGAYIASVPEVASLTSDAVEPILGFAGMLKPEDKISLSLAGEEYEDWALEAEPDKVKVLVEFFADVTVAQARTDLRDQGLEGEPHGARTWALTVEKSRVKEIAELDSVKWIEQGPTPFLPLNETGRRRSDSNEAQAAILSNPQPGYQVSGSGVQLGICDSGVDQDHTDFSTVTAAGTAGGSRVYNQRAGSGSHGTHVASIAAGNGLNSANNGLPAFHRRGHAPQAQIGDYPSFGSDAEDFHDAILGDGTDATNHSYVQSMTVYDSEAADIDLIVRGDATHGGASIPARPQVWAAGNNGTSAQYGNEEGYYAVFTSAKNTISVGSVDTLDGRISDFTSLGPTFDGRIKPDVAAPGCRDSIGVGGGIQAASSGSQGYTGKCGTSMAAPVVTGLVGLMMDEYLQTYGVFPGLRPATYKAMLVHTARDQVKTRPYASREFNNPDTGAPALYHAGPDFATGYGLVDAEGVRDLITRATQWKEATIGATGQYHMWCMSVPEGTEEVKATLAWDDEPGDTTAAETVAKLVNDLDLRLVQPDGTVIRPWTLDPLPLTANPGDGAQDPIQPADVNPAYRGLDRRNNVEMANTFLPNSGIWKVIVRGHLLPLGTSQPYSLTTSHPIQSFCPVMPPKFCDLYPALCPVRNICWRYPWICKIRGKVPIHIREGIWRVDPRTPTPIDEICKYVLDCPGCEGKGRSYCPGWQIQLKGVPVDAAIIIFNQRGDIVGRDSTPTPNRAVAVRQMRPGDVLFIAFTDGERRPYGQEFSTEFKVVRGR